MIFFVKLVSTFPDHALVAQKSPPRLNLGIKPAIDGPERRTHIYATRSRFPSGIVDLTGSLASRPKPAFMLLRLKGLLTRLYWFRNRSGAPPGNRPGGE